jgi:hypothetical protein
VVLEAGQERGELSRALMAAGEAAAFDDREQGEPLGGEPGDRVGSDVPGGELGDDRRSGRRRRGGKVRLSRKARVSAGDQLHPSAGDADQRGLLLVSGFAGELFGGVVADQVVGPVPRLVGRVDPGGGQQGAVGKPAHYASRVVYAEQRGDLPLGELGGVE